VRAGKLRALGVLGRRRFEALPDVAAVAETLPGYEASTWGGIGVPRGTPHEIVERLNREVNEVLKEPDLKARFADVGTLPLVLNSEEFRAYIAAEFEKWDKVVKVAGIKRDRAGRPATAEQNNPEVRW
jgi:tripartite-type tricarboxylate transporter receptor subunit TctC